MTTIRPLTVHDIPAAQRLREQAGWNQTDADWRRLLAWSPDGCWAAERDGQILGTTAVTTYGRRIAWIGMVLVDEAHRRQGIGRALLGHALGHLDRLGIGTIALDSTPEGQPLYARLGFADAFELARWRGPIPPSFQSPSQGVTSNATLAGSAAVPAASSPPEQQDAQLSQPTMTGPAAASDTAATGPTHRYQPTPLPTDPASPARSPASEQVETAIRPLTPDDLPALAAYDARLFGTDRAHILGALFSGHPGRCFVAERHGQISGYVLSRPGARAWHLGPLAGDDPPTAEHLARLALPPVPDNAPPAIAASAPTPAEPRDLAASAGLPADMVMDVVMPNPGAVDLATALGLTRIRRFIRMTRGAPPPTIDAGRLYTSAGPELG